MKKFNFHNTHEERTAGLKVFKANDYRLPDPCPIKFPPTSIYIIKFFPQSIYTNKQHSFTVYIDNNPKKGDTALFTHHGPNTNQLVNKYLSDPDKVREEKQKNTEYFRQKAEKLGGNPCGYWKSSDIEVSFRRINSDYPNNKFLTFPAIVIKHDTDNRRFVPYEVPIDVHEIQVLLYGDSEGNKKIKPSEKIIHLDRNTLNNESSNLLVVNQTTYDQHYSKAYQNNSDLEKAIKNKEYDDFLIRRKNEKI
jgi:hypothetical protein